MKHALTIALAVSLAGLIVSIGMRSTIDDLLYVLRRPKLLFKAFLAVDVIPPTAAFTLIKLLPLTTVVKTGIALMAVSPVPPMVPGRMLGAGARKEYAYGVYVAMSLLTIVEVPIWVAIGAALFGKDRRADVGLVAAMIVKTVLIPLAVGLVVRHFMPGFSAKAAPWLFKVCVLLVVLLATPIIILIWPSMARLIGNGTLATMAVVVLIALVGGHALGGPDPQDRKTLALASAVRHPGMAITVGTAARIQDDFTAAVLLFVLVGVAVTFAYQLGMKAGRPHSRTPAPHGARA
jgi:BASS family bile acid:Na+ symporter